MAIQFHRAQRQKAKLRLAIAGPAGSGKTYSALLIGFGLGGSIALIDTERGSGELYAHLGEYDVCSLEAPFTPEKYVEAIQSAEAAGYTTIIIDSLSHAWAGPGGVLDIHGYEVDKSKSGNSWTAWRQVTPRHNDLVDAMLQSNCHVIATLRSKMEHVQTVENGKTVIKKVGMNPVQRDGMEYEFTTFIDMDQNHKASASKDRTGLFDGRVFKPTLETGGNLLQWLEVGAEAQHQAGRQTNLMVVEGGQASVSNSAGSGYSATSRPLDVPSKVNKQSPPPITSQPIRSQAAVSQTPALATQAQVKKIYATAGNAGLGESMLHQIIEQEAGVTSVKDLSKAEASRMIEFLISMANGGRNQQPNPETAPSRAASSSRKRLI